MCGKLTGGPPVRWFVIYNSTHTYTRHKYTYATGTLQSYTLPINSSRIYSRSREQLRSFQQRAVLRVLAGAQCGIAVALHRVARACISRAALRHHPRTGPPLVLLARARVVALEAKEGEELVTLLQEAARPVADHTRVPLRRHPPHRHGGGGAPNGLVAATAYVRGILEVLRLMRARARVGVGFGSGCSE